MNFREYIERNLQLPQNLQGYDPTNWSQRNQSYNPDNPLEKVDPVTLNTEQVKAWRQIVNTQFPGGAFEQNTTDEQLATGKVRPNFIRYSTKMLNRSVDFTVSNRAGKIYATVDFNWADPSQVQQSGREQSLTGSSGEGEGGNKVAAQMQSGSKQFMDEVRQKYLVPLSHYGINVSFNTAYNSAEGDRRTGVYDKVIQKSGFRPQPGLPGGDRMYQPDQSQWGN